MNDLTSGIVFLRQKTFLLSNDIWNVIMEIPLQPYKDAIEKTSNMINTTLQESWVTKNPGKLAEHVQLEMKGFIFQPQNLRDEINELSTESLIRKKRNFAPVGFIRGDRSKCLELFPLFIWTIIYLRYQ